MKKLGKGILLVVYSVAMVGLLVFPVQAAENLSNWTVKIFSGIPQLTPNGESVTVVANGSGGSDLGILWKHFPGSFGMLTEISVSELQGNNSWCGPYQYVGRLPSGNPIKAVIGLDRLDGDNRIRYRVIETDMNFEELRVLAYGFLGNYKDGWSIGVPVLVGLARLGDDIYFYTPTNGAFVKVQLFEKMWPYDHTPGICVLAENPGDSIRATIRNVIILR